MGKLSSTGKQTQLLIFFSDDKDIPHCTTNRDVPPVVTLLNLSGLISSVSTRLQRPPMTRHLESMAGKSQNSIYKRMGNEI